MSGNASLIVVAEKKGYIYKSTDLGLSWSRILGDTNTEWASVSMDSKALNIAAAPPNGYVQKSNDAGATWTNFSPFQAKWASIALEQSWNGPQISAGKIYMS